jgi:hypothetical protein
VAAEVLEQARLARSVRLGDEKTSVTSRHERRKKIV